MSNVNALSDRLIARIEGSRVSLSAYWNNGHGMEGTVTKYEPFGGAMCDAMVTFDDGYECWYSSRSLKRIDGVALPDRREVCEARRIESITQLELILDKFIKVDFHQPWPCCEFAKTLIGNGIVGAIDELKSRG